jgi:long-chain-fatty-acid--CoA ligase ACSBG
VLCTFSHFVVKGRTQSISLFEEKMTHRFCAVEPSGYVEPLLTGSGAAAIPAETIYQRFKGTVDRFPDRPAMGLKRKPEGGQLPAEWKIWSWRQYWNDCTKFAKTLIHLDVALFKVINIIGFNSPEWFIANCGAIFAGGIAAGVYTTNTPSACHYISEHSEAEVVVVEGLKQLMKYTSLVSTLPKLKYLVVWGDPVDEATKGKFGSVRVCGFEEFLTIGERNGVADDAIELRQRSVKPGNCSTLIYTSGTTGPPKAVMISHDNVCWTVKNLIDTYLDLNHKDRFVSYLPLSHIAGQVIDIHAPMYVGSATYFAQPDALKGSLSLTLRDVRPTIFFGVPRVWEKIQEKMVQMGRESTGVKKFLATWAKKMGTEHTKRSQFGAGGGTPCTYSCANALVLSKIREALGLDQCKGCFTAAAPISTDTLWYFGSLDIPVYEVFGQSECTGPHTVSCEGNWKIGACGRPMPGTLSVVATGNKELCYKGRHIFMGYMHDLPKTLETIDSEGFLHSGDVAEFDEDEDPRVPSPSGFMRITGRIKELIITAGGENIPPVLIENEMKAAMVALSNCMVIGDKRKFLSMLVTLKVEVDSDTGAPTNNLAADALYVGRQIGSSAKTTDEAKADPKWIEYITKGMKEGNSKTTSNAQIVQKFELLTNDFSEKAGELTPTLKLKRNIVAEKYAKLIDSMYEGAGDS